jgi:hypothetical protein
MSVDNKGMTVGEAVKHPLFPAELEKAIRNALKARSDARHTFGWWLKRARIDNLEEQGLLQTERFIDTYIAVLNKTKEGMGSSQRNVILYLGNTAVQAVVNKQ